MEGFFSAAKVPGCDFFVAAAFCFEDKRSELCELMFNVFVFRNLMKFFFDPHLLKRLFFFLYTSLKITENNVECRQTTSIDRKQILSSDTKTAVSL